MNGALLASTRVDLYSSRAVTRPRLLMLRVVWAFDTQDSWN
jgi:hypothetical protein